MIERFVSVLYSFQAAMMATDITNFAMVTDRSTQGVVNALLLMRLMKGPGGGLLNHKDVATINGARVRVDGTKRSYFGNSQGGILGSLYVRTSSQAKLRSNVPAAPCDYKSRSIRVCLFIKTKRRGRRRTRTGRKPSPRCAATPRGNVGATLPCCCVSSPGLNVFGCWCVARAPPLQRYMSVSTDVERGLIGVGGSPYSLLLPRSKDFSALGTVLQLRYPDPLALSTIMLRA